MRREAEPEIIFAFAVKDTYYTAGVRTTAGTNVLRDHIPAFDATIVRKLKTDGGHPRRQDESPGV